MAELIMTDEEKKSESFLTWSDESLGKAVKAAAFALADDTGRQSVMWTTAACLLIKKMLEADSTTLVITLEQCSGSTSSANCRRHKPMPSAKAWNS